MPCDHEDSGDRVSLDKQALLRVVFKFKQALGVFETTGDEAAQGYLFSWGHIEERRIENWVLWDFHFDHLREHDPSTGLTLGDLRRKLFDELEQLLDCAVREPLGVPSLVNVWCIVLGSGLSEFSVVTHFFHEEAARQWVAETLIPEIPPCLTERVETHVEPGLP